MACRGRPRPERRLVRPVHGENQVEAVKIGGLDLPRPLRRNVDPVARGGFDRTRVGRVALVPVAGAGRIDGDMRSEPRIDQHLAQNALGQGRAADIAHADKQHRKLRRVGAVGYA